MSIPRDERDEISGVIFNSGNTGIDMTQDIVTKLGVAYMADKVVKGTIYNLGGKQLLEASTKRLNAKITKEMLERLSKVATQKVQGKLATQMSKMMAKQTAKMALSAMGKAAASAGTKAAGATAGGCTMGPAGCAAGAAIGWAIFIAEMSFSLATFIQDLQDKSGILQLLHKDFVDDISNTFASQLNEGNKELVKQLGDEESDYLDTEVFFHPELFIYDNDPDDGTFYMDSENEWAVKFIEYQNEYLTKIGIEPGWELRVLTGEFDTPDLSSKKYISEKDQKKIATGIVMSFVMLSILLICFFLIILIV